MTMQQKSLKVGVALMVGVAVVAALFAWPHRTKYLPASVKSQTPAIHDDQPKTAMRTRNTAAALKAGVINYKKLFAESRDYWTLAHDLLPAANAGDADAQFYLSRVMEFCEEGNSKYFQHKGVNLTLGEGLQYAAQLHMSDEVARSVFEKCHGFQEGNLAGLGGAADWLAKATAAGQPIAEATTASKILMQTALQNAASAARVPNPNPTDLVGNGGDPRALLRAAVESKDPEVLFSIGEAQAMLDPSSPDDVTTRFAWWLVACQRGLDCTWNADWVKTSCGGDPQCESANDPNDLVRMLAGDKWPDVQQRAQQIDAALDAGQWSEVGLGS